MGSFAGAGGNVNLTAANGADALITGVNTNGGGQGGDVTVRAGVSGNVLNSDGNPAWLLGGGNVRVYAGNSGTIANGAYNGSVGGGLFLLQSGNGTDIPATVTKGSSSSGIAGGQFTLNSGSGGASYVNGISGGSGGPFVLSSNNGGNCTGVGSANNFGGTSGYFFMNAAGGGSASGSTARNLAGSAGGFTLLGGDGGYATCNATNVLTRGGAGSPMVITAGNGGGISGTLGSGTLQLGSGGALTLTSGSGPTSGTALTGKTYTGGVGGDLSLLAGNGVSVTGANSIGGSIYLLPGLSSGTATPSYILLGGDNAGNIRGKVGVGIIPTAALTLKAGTATAGTAPLKFTSGTLLTGAEAGAVEFLTDDFFATITTGAARKAFVLDDGTRLTATRVPFAGTNGRLVDDADITFVTDTLTVTKIVGTTSIKVGTAGGYISSDNSTGATGSFTTVDLKTVTVKDGIITSIV